MAILTILAISERNGQKSQNGHAKKLLCTFCTICTIEGKVPKVPKVQCKNFTEKRESRLAHMTKAIYLEVIITSVSNSAILSQ